MNDEAKKRERPCAPVCAASINKFAALSHGFAARTSFNYSRSGDVNNLYKQAYGKVF
ncbi:MAG: hypothetical protein L0229_16560 [Blastocatellia bacterium]|nr:hypothetical protein [Blastocatellia bacterium]